LAKISNLLVSFFCGTDENYNIGEEAEHSWPALAQLSPNPDFFLPQGVYFLTKSRLLSIVFYIQLI